MSGNCKDQKNQGTNTPRNSEKINITADTNKFTNAKAKTNIEKT